MGRTRVHEWHCEHSMARSIEPWRSSSRATRCANNCSCSNGIGRRWGRWKDAAARPCALPIGHMVWKRTFPDGGVQLPLSSAGFLSQPTRMWVGGF